MAADLIGVLEAGYDLDGSDQLWMERVLGAIHPVLNRGMGTAAFLFTIDGQGLNLSAPTTREVVGPGLQILQGMNAGTPPEMVIRLYVDPPPCSTVATALGLPIHWDPVVRKQFLPYIDVPDVLGLRANSGRRVGAFLCAPMKRVGPPVAREAMLLNRLASHVGAGLRLRRRLAAEAAARPLDDAEAILTPSGKLEHAAGPAKDKGAREALATAARSVDRARGRLRRADPDEAVTLWRALVAGQWSLVDHFDHDGRRFVVAHRNQMLDARERLGTLSDRERQVAMLAALGHGNKLIAYDLGIGLSTVSVYLTRAAAKLGASCRVSLIQLLKSMPER